jgi:S-adenosylmethionine:tRNA ribosyltransferase-isomerase
MSDVPPDFSLQSYSFELPEERIAQWPAPERGESRLMILPKSGGRPTVGRFGDILTRLPEGCLLVANNSRVVPARLLGKRPGGGKVEFLLLTPLPLLAGRKLHPLFPGWQWVEADGLFRPSRKIKIGEIISFSAELAVELLARGDYGRCRVTLSWQGDLLALLEKLGSPPLPPYIKRGKGDNGKALDRERYQTVYARMEKSGSVAAPTAGLHFTPALCEALRQSGREWAELTLHVGYGTFSPVRSKDIREHAMHAEYVEIDAAVAEAVNRAKAEGRAVIAVGTTACRSLEGMSALQGGTGHLDPAACWVDHFLYPGKPFTVVDGLITNFHLPGSSLIMLVSALAGRERVLDAYQEAIRQGFRFFSYGDAMLIC